MNYFMNVFTEIGKRQREAVQAGRYEASNAWTVTEDHWDRCFKGVSYREGLGAFQATMAHVAALEILTQEERAVYEEASRLAEELWPQEA